MPGLLCYRGKRKGKERKGTPVLRDYPYDILHARLFPLLLHRVPPGQKVAECSGRRALVPSYALTCPPTGQVGLPAKSLLRLSLFIFFSCLGGGGGGIQPRLGPRGPFATLHWRGTKILETTECGRQPPMLSDALYGLAHVCDQHLTKS
jgi:hypothetical protein